MVSSLIQLKTIKSNRLLLLLLWLIIPTESHITGVVVDLTYTEVFDISGGVDIAIDGC